MDASPLFDPQYFPIIAATLIGFGILAALLLVPIYRFLDREQEVAEHWTPEELAKRIKRQEESTQGKNEEALRAQNDDSEHGGDDEAKQQAKGNAAREQRDG